MISSFFSKTKPINYLVILGFCALLYLLIALAVPKESFEAGFFIQKILGVFFLLLTFFAINPTLKADKLAELSSFTMLFYALLIALFLPAILNEKIVISNFLILISTDKVLALKFDKRTKYKIFEASLFVFLASVMIEWALVFLIPIYFGIYAYCGSQLRNWLLPLAALVTFLLGLASYAALFNDWGFIQNHYVFNIDLGFDYISYLGVAIYMLVSLILIFVTLIKLGNRGIGRILSLRILVSYFLLSFLIIFLSSEYGLEAILFTFFSASVLFTNYFETIKNKRFKEILLAIFIVASLAVSVFHLVQ